VPLPPRHPYAAALLPCWAAMRQAGLPLTNPHRHSSLCHAAAFLTAVQELAGNTGLRCGACLSSAVADMGRLSLGCTAGRHQLARQGGWRCQHTSTCISSITSKRAAIPGLILRCSTVDKAVDAANTLKVVFSN